MEERYVSHLPGVCEPVYSLSFDHERLIRSTEILCQRIGMDMQMQRTMAINLTHLPGIKGADRWSKYNQSHLEITKEGLTERDFVEPLAEMTDLYLHEVIQEINLHHPGGLTGRVQLTWIASGFAYPLHRDLQSPHRYHIPLISNPWCRWSFLDDTHDITYRLHMPASGMAWYLDPITFAHTVSNEGERARLHLLISDYS